MERVIAVASYIFSRYQEAFSSRIDEMKLHKLLYFAQRESLIQNEEPLFEDLFQAWKYGPVMVCVRDKYAFNLLNEEMSKESVERNKDVFDYIFEHYAKKDSWSLSLLTHGEFSWKNARHNIKTGDSCSNEMSLDDIKKDAERIKQRRIKIKNYLSSQDGQNK